jgi:hypothetical protein
MKMNLSYPMLTLLLICTVCAYSQVDIDKPINLSGGVGERAITNLELPVNGTDAVNKDYVDNAVSAGGGGLRVTDLYGDGIIAFVNRDTNGEEHGLIVSLVDNSAGTVWTNVGQSDIWNEAYNIGPAARDWYDGQFNVSGIMGQSGHTSSAAKICDDFTTANQTDWYLPAIHELRLIHNNIREINWTLRHTSNTPISDNSGPVYWSSTEQEYYSVLTFNFTNGINDSNYKNTTSVKVRCVRRF